MSNQVRYREKSTLSNHTVSYETRGWSTGYNWTPNGSFVVGVGDYRWMNDVVTPDFRAKRARGSILMNHMYRRLTSVQATGSTLSGKHKTLPNTGFRWNGCVAANFFQETVTEQGYTLPAMIELLTSDNLNSLVTEVCTSVWNQRGRSQGNLWETLAEFNKSLELFLNPLQRYNKRMYKILKAASRRRGMRESVQTTAELWATYRWGIRPIIQDIATVFEGLFKSPGVQRLTTRDKGSLVDTSQSVNIVDNFIHYGVVTDVRDEIIVRAMSIDDVELTFANHLGFTTKGLVTLPWELVTASFVADWFGNLGDFIGAIAPAPGWHQLGSCYTVTRTRRNQWTVTGVGSGASYDVDENNISTYVRETSDKYRIPMLAPPGIIVRSDFRFDKITRVADAISLAVILTKRAFRLK